MRLCPVENETISPSGVDMKGTGPMKAETT